MNKFQFNLESQSGKGWVDRAEKCIELLKHLMPMLSACPSIADVGCGDQKLKTALKTNLMNFDYQGYDINPQTIEVRKYNANIEKLERSYDVAAVLGLTEYINLEFFMKTIRENCSYMVVSHVLNTGQYDDNQLKRLGWINHLKEEEFEHQLEAAEFEIMAKSTDYKGKTRIWLCK